MVRQYPYQLQVLLMVDNGQDPNGNTLPPTSSWSNLCVCRDEAGNGKMIRTVDGNAIVFSFLIQMPKGVQAIQPGTKVRVQDADNNTRCTGTVIFSRRDQLHSRAWV